MEGNAKLNDFTMEQLLFLLKRKIVPKKPIGFSHVKFAIEDGMYMGCPGKEIFFSMSKLSVEDREKLVDPIISLFPRSLNSRSVHYSLFWRYFYGVFDKRGLLNKKKDNTIQVSSLWNDYFFYADHIMSCFPPSHYGYVVALEMKAHRVGDLFLLTKEDKYKKQMLDMYDEVYRLSPVVGAKKNAFSSMFWCSVYLYEAKEFKLYNAYAIKFLHAVNKYNTSVTAKGKVVSTLNKLYITMTRKQFKGVLNLYKNLSNKTMRTFGFKKLSFDKSLLGI